MRLHTGALLLLAICLLPVAQAHAVTIPTVTIGHAGNLPDPADGDSLTPGVQNFGAVAYKYSIGMYEVTVGQYTSFLNAVAATDTYGLYSTSMALDANSAGIARTGSPGSYTYSVIGSADRPVTYVNWGDAARFANWLHNGQPIGGQNASTTERGAYALNGATTAAALANVARNPGALWFLPSEDEWYKAAYHNNDGVTNNYWAYPMSANSPPDSDQPPGSDAPTQSNTGNFFNNDGLENFYNDGYAVIGSTSLVSSQNYLTDVGAYTHSASPYGTYDQGGNVWEWTEASIFPFDAYRGVRGGAWANHTDFLRASARTWAIATSETSHRGFRVAAATVPEPSAFALAAAGVLGLVVSLRSRRRRACLLLVALVACCRCDAQATGIAYTVTDLGTLGGTYSYATDINDLGQVTGFATTLGNFATRAFFYDGTMHALGTLGGATSQGEGINNHGQIAGTSTTASGARHAFLYDGSMHDLGTLGGTESIGADINDAGQVVGSSDTTNNALTRGFKYDGTMHDLGTLGGSLAMGYGINTGGATTGWASTGSGLYHAFVSNGSMYDIGAINGPTSFGYAINDHAHVTGTSSAVPTNFFKHAFLYDGVMHDLGTIGGSDSVGYGVNNSGVVTGDSLTTGNVATRAVVYDNVHGMRDLNALIDPASGWTLLSGSAVNNLGQIVGVGVIEGETHAFLLTPATPPTKFLIDAAQSSLTLTADIEGVIPIVAQLPGSMTTALAGSLSADLLGSPNDWTNIRILSTNDVHATPQPGPFQPGGTAADLAAFADLGFATAFATFNDSVMDLSSAFLTIDPSGAFALDEVFARLESHLAYQLTGVTSGTSTATGNGVLGGVGTVEQFGNTLTITIPFDTSFSTPLPELGGLAINYHFTGQLVATAAVPEPSTFALIALGGVGLLMTHAAARARGRVRL